MFAEDAGPVRVLATESLCTLNSARQCACVRSTETRTPPSWRKRFDCKTS